MKQKININEIVNHAIGIINNDNRGITIGEVEYKHDEYLSVINHPIDTFPINGDNANIKLVISVNPKYVHKKKYVLAVCYGLLAMIGIDDGFEDSRIQHMIRKFKKQYRFIKVI